jgi:hypothetical protein
MRRENIKERNVEKLVGQPVDISASAYIYRADCKHDGNPPESWIAIMHYAGQALNKPLDMDDPVIKQVLCGLLWEEIRPVQQMELTWSADAHRRPLPEAVVITILENRGAASSWWNNLDAVRKAITPTVTDQGKTVTYNLNTATCGIIVSVEGPQNASDYETPGVRVLTADTWKKMDVEIEWGFDQDTTEKDYSGQIEVYDGMVFDLQPLRSDALTTINDVNSWNSVGKGAARRGIKFSLLYMGTAARRQVQPFTSQQDDAARTIVTLWTKGGNFSFLAADLENGPILAPEYGFFVRRAAEMSPPAPSRGAPTGLASQAASAQEFIKELQAKKLTTIRQRTRTHEEQTWEGAVMALNGANLPPNPTPPAGYEPSMQVEVPSERLTAQWNLGMWHLVRHCEKNPKNGRLWFNDYPYGILAAETYMILAALDLMGAHQAAEDGFDQWVSLPMQPRVEPGQGQGGDDGPDKQHVWSLADRPSGNFFDGMGCFTLAEGVPGIGGHMDGVHAFGPGAIGWALTEHYWMTGDKEWLEAAAARMKANTEWILRQRRLMSSLVPGGERLWCKGLQPALQVTPDSGGLWMQFYECEAYYWACVSRLAATLAVIDPERSAQLAAEAESYRNDLRAAVERSIALSPVVPTRDGAYHSVIPFACYVRGLANTAWGWYREGSVEHVGPLYWDTVQSAAALVSPADLLPADDVRVQGYLDVLEDRLLLENPKLQKRTPDYDPERHWFAHAGWQYQGGLERTANMHLAGDDIPVFLRSFLNCYAIDILPHGEYVFNEHATQGPADKIFEEAAFLERFRNLLVMEERQNLWLARATPRAWLEQGKKISVKNAPTFFGAVDYEIASDIERGKITATVKMPSRNPAEKVLLRLRHPQAAPIKSVEVNGAVWKDFDPVREIVILGDIEETVKVEVTYSSNSS